MTYLLDSDFVIDCLTGHQSARAQLDALLPHGAAISIITYSEIYEGIYGSVNPREAVRGFTLFLTGIAVLPVNRVVAKRNAQVRLDLRVAKRPIAHRALDLLIGATALAHDLELVTRNTVDFHDIPGLTLYSLN